MNIDKKLVSQFAGVLAVAMLFGTSAFAEDRHRDETNRGERREFHQRDQSRTEEHRSNESHNNNHDRNNRQFDNNNQWRGSNEHRDYRYNNNDHRNDYRNNDHRYNNDHRNDYRNNDRYRGSRDYGHRGTPYYAHGRISRIEPWNHGYRLWVGGALYPFFVPEVFFRSHRLRVGIDINLGGYYNPLGYYDYYDEPYYDGGYSSYSSGALRGVVETVDFRRGTFVIRDDISGNFVTVVMRGRDYDFGRIRPGDYVDVAGDWSRNGLFEAYRADLLEDSYYRR